tara:strand:+ start:1638 stop:3833 length:2196 start_codon:yes stop_codon:yes gene_type:complete
MAQCNFGGMTDYQPLQDAYLGVAFPNASPAQQATWAQNLATGHPIFVESMWTNYNIPISIPSPGCIGCHFTNCDFWTSRVAHWQNQILSQNLNPYNLQLKQAKIAFAGYFHGHCNCDGPTPAIAPPRTNTINNFFLDLSDLPAVSEARVFSIIGTSGAEFKLIIKNNDTGYHYNFVTGVFQAAEASLQEKITGNKYEGNITFPAVTGSDDQYDVSLYALVGTEHQQYKEVRFGDGSIDINSSTGSNSLVLSKVIYQYAALTLTLQGYSPGGTVSGTIGTDTVSINRGKPTPPTAFSFATTAATTAAYRILKQPVIGDVISFVEPVAGELPIDLPGENTYPTATAAFTGDDVNGAVTSGSVVRMDNTDLSAVIKIGDKITTPVTTDTVNGARDTSSVTVTMDAVTAATMAVGDRVTGNADLDRSVITVASIGSGGSANRFDLSEVIAIADGATLTFSSKINRSLTTVTVVETSGTATDFTMSQAIQFRDNTPLTFFPRMNYSWPINNFADILKEDMIVVQGTNITTDTSISIYEDIVTLFEGTKEEKKIIKNFVPALGTLAKKPTVVKGLVTVQEGQIVFDKQQALALAGDTLKIGGYGQSEILRLYGWDVRLTDLAITLTPVTTTTTEATSAHATIAIASKEGVINSVSRVGGLGINPSLQNPLITSGGGATGAGDWIMDATQTLENGVTLTVENTSRIATITGNIVILKAGTANQTLRFDLNKLLSTTAP